VLPTQAVCVDLLLFIYSLSVLFSHSLIVISYPESNIKVIFHNISYNFLLILQVKQSIPLASLSI
jgi:hypothetical protein